MLPIQKRLIRYNYSSRNGRKIEYIVVHDTGNTGRGADVNAHFNFFNGADRQSSADYFVDDHSIGQFVEDWNYSWHCGDGKGRYGITNSNSIGVEICINSDGNYVQAVKNAAELVRYLMGKYHIDIDHVVRHYDASRKSCPNQIINGKDGITWTKFKQMVMGSDVNVTAPVENKNGFYESSETRTNATLVGEGSIKVLDKDCNHVSGRWIDSLDRLFVVGIYPSRNYIEVVYPAGGTKYHAYISIEYYSRLSFDYHMEYINDGGETYVWWSAEDVNVEEHNEVLQPNQKASPMYRTNGWLRVTFYRENGEPSDGYVRYEGSQGTKFYEEAKPQYGVVKVNSYLNVRSTPGGSVIGKVFNNEKVLIKWTEDGCYYIQYDTPNGKKEGYVSADYVEKV
ncbi:N-acetylmuramoyl-L-alanine amidase [Clostridium perfringens]|uniref:N-acetylmuramoyl-L-alanine amidase n=1 Tax=Clostridium perfringens TaxID=1502 RepID=UPI0039EB07F5